MTDIALVADKIKAMYLARAEIVDLIAAEAITVGQAVYVDTAGKCGVADANVTGKTQFRGIALQTKATGQTVPVLKRGHIAGFTVSGLNGDAILYLSETAGALADAAGLVPAQAGRVTVVPDASLTKVVYIEADWLRTWVS